MIGCAMVWHLAHLPKLSLVTCRSHDKIDQGYDAKANVTKHPTGTLQYLTSKIDN